MELNLDICKIKYVKISLKSLLIELFSSYSANFFNKTKLCHFKTRSVDNANYYRTCDGCNFYFKLSFIPSASVHFKNLTLRSGLEFGWF